MFGMKKLPARFRTEQACQALEILKQHNIRCQMPSDDMFFTSAFHLPHPDLRWQIMVRRRDHERAMALLVEEGLAKQPVSGEMEGSPADAGLPSV
jgi:hypothetical protein